MLSLIDKDLKVAVILTLIVFLIGTPIYNYVEYGNFTGDIAIASKVETSVKETKQEIVIQDINAEEIINGFQNEVTKVLSENLPEVDGKAQYIKGWDYVFDSIEITSVEQTVENFINNMFEFMLKDCMKIPQYSTFPKFDL